MTLAYYALVVLVFGVVLYLIVEHLDYFFIISAIIYALLMAYMAWAIVTGNA